MNIGDRIAAANQRLKEEGYKISIHLNGTKTLLVLRGIFPPKPDHPQEKPYQQRISLKLPANPRGLKLAEKEARWVAGCLEKGNFDWNKYLRHDTNESYTVQDWLNLFEENHWRSHTKNHSTESSWRCNYKPFISLLSGYGDKTLTAKLLHSIILEYPIDSSLRLKAKSFFHKLAKLADISLDLSDIPCTYTPRQNKGLEIPSDEIIFNIYFAIPNKQYQWIYGLLATYGLRPHEAFRCNLDRLKQGDRILEIGENTKTGYREVYPLYPEWFEDFNLSDIHCPIINTERSNHRISQSISGYFSRHKDIIPFIPYVLRHAWAVRSLSFNFPLSFAAQQMGHSVDIHTSTYHKWITREHSHRVYELLMQSESRPQAPIKKTF